VHEQDSRTRQIVVMRHSKAEQSGPTDFERTLTDRGRRDAAAAGRWLAGRGLVADHALVSAAVRAVQTWESLAQGAEWDVEPDLDRGFYAASPETALDLMRTTPEEARTLVVVGHNPTVATLAHLLDDGEGDPGAAGEMAGGYPTSALVVMSYDGTWADLAEGAASLTGFHVGRG
jgi:phosphohistidine phosphatase